MLPIDSHWAGSQHVRFSLSLPYKDLVNHIKLPYCDKADIRETFSHEQLVNEMMSLTYGELELLICLHFPMAATRINKEGKSLWCG